MLPTEQMNSLFRVNDYHLPYVNINSTCVKKNHCILLNEEYRGMMSCDSPAGLFCVWLNGRQIVPPASVPNL